MRASRLVMVGLVLGVTACASPQPVVQASGRPYGGYQNDPLRKTANDANSVESIASSVTRVARLLSGSGF